MRKVLVYILLYLATSSIIILSFVLKSHPVDSPILSVIRIIIVIFASVLLFRYSVYMLLAPWYTRKKKPDSPPRQHYQPLVSVMIPAWNEQVGVLATIKSLLASTYQRLEIVIVNDGSTDHSDWIIRNFIAKYHRTMLGIPEQERIQIVYHYQENGGKGSALNTAIRLSHGDILLSIDADCIVDKHTVEAFVDAFRDPEVMAAVGNVKIGNTKTLVGIVQLLEFRFGFYMKKSDSLLNTIYIIGGAAGAFRREVFKKIGGYSTTNITEDIHLSMRIQAAGMKSVYVAKALVYTEGASTLRSLLKQRLRWKRGRFQTFWEYRQMFFSLKPEHNKILCWFILPLTLFSEVQLGLEPLFILVLYVFSFLSGDFSAFLSGVIVVSLMFFIQAWDAKEEQGMGYVLLAPIGWLLFYICTFVEVYALTKSIWMKALHKEVKWQRWQRTGVTN